jgi:hypothetical protein
MDIILKIIHLYSTYKIIVHGLPFIPTTIVVNDKEITKDGHYFENNSLVLIADRMSFINFEILK